MSNITIDGKGGFVGDMPANKEELMRQSDSALTIAESYIVDCPEMREAAMSDVTLWKKRKAALEEQRLSVTRPLDAAKSALMAIFKSPVERLDVAINTVSGCVLAYDAKVREAAAIERRKAEAIAEAERKRLQALADEERRKAEEIAAEAARAAEEESRKAKELIAAAAAEDARLRRVAEEAARAGDVDAQREAEEAAAANMKKAQEEAFAAQLAKENQEKIDAQAKHEAAERARAAETALAATSSVETAAVNTKGTRSAWKGKCNDKMALLKFIVDNPSFIHLVEVSESALNAQAKSMKEAMKIDGCISYQERTVVASRS